MSAIAGIWHLDGKPSAAEDCARMLGAQQIYGPHNGRQWEGGSVAIGRRLYRLLPEDAFDHQPLQSADGRFVLVADVRLDNRCELATDLNWPHARTIQASDATILLAALEHWREAALDRLAGDFAFALWDVCTERLLLARDFLGQRPLHYHRVQSFVAFASMAKGLHALPDIPYAPDEQGVAEFVTLMPQSGPRSFFKDIERVEAGQVVVISRGGISKQCYWTPRRPVRSGAKDWVEGLRYHLDQATSVRLRGGKVATQLSSGFDSAAVTATAAKLLADDKLVAFTAVPREGYDGTVPKGRIGDEGPLAAATAALYSNIEHVLIRTGHLSPIDDLDRTFFLCERPILNLCNWVWARAINNAAREHKCAILLTGQMGNMSISYNGLELLPELLSKGRLLKLAREAEMLVAMGERRWRGILASIIGPFVPATLWQWAHRAFGRQGADILHYTAIRNGILDALNLAVLAKERDLDFAYRPWTDSFAMRLWVLRRMDLGNYNKGILAGWGLDQRDPTADRRLVEFCLSVPTEAYLSKGVPRALAKRALADRLPQAVLRERRKGYQAVDWHEGLTAARDEARIMIERLTSFPPAARLLNTERLKRLVDDWPASGWERDEVMHAYRLALLRGVSAGHFLRSASGSN